MRCARGISFGVVFCYVGGVKLDAVITKQEKTVGFYARREPSFLCTISRHGIVQASLTLLIWLIEMVAFSSDVGRSLRPTVGDVEIIKTRAEYMLMTKQGVGG